MKNVLTCVLFSVGFVFATERFTMNCFFEGVAKGYSDKFYSRNMIKDGNSIFNSDGTYGRIDLIKNKKKGLTGGGAFPGQYYFDIFDGKNWWSGDYEGKTFKFNEPNFFERPTGNFWCIPVDGWMNEQTPEKNFRQSFEQGTK